MEFVSKISYISKISRYISSDIIFLKISIFLPTLVLLDLGVILELRRIFFVYINFVLNSGTRINIFNYI